METRRGSAAPQPSRGRGRPTTRESAGASLGTILNLIRSGRATTRQELERESELGRAVVADRVATLAELGFIAESELGTASGGRAPRLVRFNKDLGHIVVATVDQWALGVGIADLSGRLFAEHHEPIDPGSDALSTAQRIISLFDWMIAKHEPASPVWGIAVSVPRTVSDAGSTPFMDRTPICYPAWDEFPFLEMLVDHFEAPVWIRSSVETMTMGERFASAGRDVRNMLFINVGDRIGAGFICEGRLYRGTHGAAGLIGQMPVQGGDRGATLDTLAGNDMIAREGRVAAESGKSPLLAELLRKAGDLGALEVSQAAQSGDPVSVEILGRSGRLIGSSVAMLANMLNPGLIVLSGTLAQTNDLLLAAVREIVYGESHPLVTRDLVIAKSQLGSSAGLVGAAMVVVESLFNPECLKDWITSSTPLEHPMFGHVRAVAKDRRAFFARQREQADNAPPLPSDGTVVP